MTKTVEKNCKACGQLITVRIADHKRGWGNFCDKACAAAYKTGQRPRDVNANHAKYSMWAKTTLDLREKYPLEKARNIKEQVGRKVKIKPVYHSPRECDECGKPTDGGRHCFDCATQIEATNAMEDGWDGHKSAG